MGSPSPSGAVGAGAGPAGTASGTRRGADGCMCPVESGVPGGAGSAAASSGALASVRVRATVATDSPVASSSRGTVPISCSSRPTASMTVSESVPKETRGADTSSSPGGIPSRSAKRSRRWDVVRATRSSAGPADSGAGTGRPGGCADRARGCSTVGSAEMDHAPRRATNRRWPACSSLQPCTPKARLCSNPASARSACQVPEASRGPCGSLSSGSRADHQPSVRPKTGVTASSTRVASLTASIPPTAVSRAVWARVRRMSPVAWRTLVATTMS